MTYDLKFIGKFIFSLFLVSQVFLWSPNLLIYNSLSIRNLGLIISATLIIYFLFAMNKKIDFIKLIKSRFFIIPVLILFYSYLFEIYHLIDKFGLSNLKDIELFLFKSIFFNKNFFIILYFLISLLYIHAFSSTFDNLYSKLLKLFLFINIILQFLQIFYNPYLGNNDYFLLRAPGFFLEPSHLAIIYSGFLATFLSTNNNFNKKEFYFFLISSFICISFVMIVVYSFLIIIYMIKKKYNLYILLALIFSFIFIIFYVDYFRFRILGIFIDTFNNGTINLSAKIFKAHAINTYQSLLKFPFGVGIGNYSFSYDNFLSNPENVNYFYVLNHLLLSHNYNDGTCNFFKIITEMGIVGIFLIFYFLKNFFKCFANEKYSSFYVFAITVFATSLLRGAGFFNSGIIFLVAYIIACNHSLCKKY